MQTKEQEQWDGKAESNLAGATADQAWSLLKHYSDLHTLLPSLADCRLIDGTDGTPGCVRHCTGHPVPSAAGGSGETVCWADERLVAIDHVGRRYSYEVVESNMGFGRYVATVSVAAAEEKGGGCKLEWRFEAEPVAGWTRAGLVMYLENGLNDIGRRIEEAFRADDA